MTWREGLRLTLFSLAVLACTAVPTLAAADAMGVRSEVLRFVALVAGVGAVVLAMALQVAAAQFRTEVRTTAALQLDAIAALLERTKETQRPPPRPPDRARWEES